MVRIVRISYVVISLTNYFSGKTFHWARNADVALSIECIRYYAGWADKITGQVLEV